VHETNPGRSCGSLRLNFRKRTKYREDAAQATTKVFGNLSRYDCRRIRDWARTYSQKWQSWDVPQPAVVFQPFEMTIAIPENVFADEHFDLS
jgi:hypothetical protein